MRILINIIDFVIIAERMQVKHHNLCKGTEMFSLDKKGQRTIVLNDGLYEETTLPDYISSGGLLTLFHSFTADRI